MAIVRVTPVEVRVRRDRRSGHPRHLNLGGAEVPVLAVECIRDESSAHPASTEPRTRFQVVTPASRLMLSYGHRSGRWLVVGLDADASAGKQAA